MVPISSDLEMEGNASFIIAVILEAAEVQPLRVDIITTAIRLRDPRLGFQGVGKFRKWIPTVFPKVLFFVIS